MLRFDETAGNNYITQPCVRTPQGNERWAIARDPAILRLAHPMNRLVAVSVDLAE